MNKVRKAFLCVGLIVFAVSLVIFAIDSVKSAINSIEIAQKDDIFGSSGEWFWISLNVIMLPIPILLSELSLIKNGYVLLTEGQPKSRKNLCAVSCVLALLVITMILLIKQGLFEYKVYTTILLINWPIIIASFVLGSNRTVMFLTKLKQ